MDILAPPDHTEPKLTLLSTLQPKEDWRRWRVAAVGSVLFHLVVAITAPNFHYSPSPPRKPEEFLVKHVTPLYLPPELTQKAPNKTPVKKELTLASIAPRPVLKAPSAPAAQQAAPAKQMPVPPVQVAQIAPKPVIVEAPKIEATPPSPQPVQIANAPPLPPPPGNAPPKLTLEDVAPRRASTTPPSGGITMPSTSVQDAVRGLQRTGAAGSSAQGDTITDDGMGAGLKLPPSAGRPQASIQLKSDAMGADWQPYMIQVMAAVRRNWFAVYPEAAKTGMRGQVVLQFSIDKNGKVVKVVFNGETPSRPLNEAAVAAISASTPMPPFPSAFRGDHIILEMSFRYNMPR